MRTKKNIEYELAEKEERIAFWETHHATLGIANMPKEVET